MQFGTTPTSTDNAVALFRDLGLPAEAVTSNLSALAAVDAKYLRDLKININNSLTAATLSSKEAYLLAVAIMVNEKNSLLQDAFSRLAEGAGATDKEIAEVISCASLMAANNVYYRFRHFMHEDFYNNAQAGIRMSIMVNPVIGKEFFELVSIAVSAVNGCEMCVTSHEKNLVQHGTDKQRIHDAVRLAAVLRSLSVLV
ncbi:carboxymuconolactone decarboxylase family protein [Flavihumibacter petaseus]|uniref:Alkyl hydroperoxide reductase AhpD n=1 Tax=Flavihumibacter petaseus NBRC 106054 TaxID=1220578 RepID=A0A0E9MZI0_9BACT|nr:carboxymuconolactone decarboxylase family protein [Flavihumibacter petaseus]GAO42806.1 alkyl hydroperoxide reductase AhpD [Flavihumibacter petaseus NBRC 106054]